MRLICLLENGSYGGSVQMLLWVAKKMREFGHDVLVCTICNSKNIRDLAPECDFVDFEITDRSLSKRSIRDSFRAVKFFAKTLEIYDPDIVLNFGDHAVYLGLLGQFLQKYRLIISERVDPYTNRNKSDKVRRFLYRFANGAVFQTEKAKQFFPESLQKRSEVIHNPVKISADKLWNAESSENKICFFGRFDNFQKRLDILLEAFSIVIKTHKDLYLDIFGSGSKNEEECIGKMIQQLGLKKRVNLCGVSHDVVGDMIRGKVLVFSSDFEGIPNVLVEAMSVAMPIVATDCSPGGAALLLENGDNGILVPRGDSTGLANGIINLLENQELAEQFGKRAKKSLTRFLEEDIARKWERYFIKIMT